MLRLFKRYYKKYVVQFTILCAFFLAQAFIQLFLLLSEMKEILDQGVAYGDVGYLYTAAGKMVFYSMLMVACSVVISYVATNIAAGVRRDLCLDCYKKVLSMKPQDFSKFGEDTLFTRCISDSDIIQKLLAMVLKTCLLVPAIVIALLVSLFFIDREILVVEGITIVIAFSVMLGIWLHTRPSFRRLQIMMDRLTLIFREKIVGVRTIRAFGSEGYELDKTVAAAEEYMDADIRSNGPLKLVPPSVMILVNLSMVIAYVIGSRQIQSGMATASTIILVIQYINLLIPCLCVLPLVVNLLPGASVSSERIMGLLDYEPVHHSPDHPSEAGMAGHASSIVAFDSVCFGYQGSKDILSNISFEIQKGDKVAIIGATGAGKSTLLYLMIGLNLPTKGSILVNGMDAAGLDPVERIRPFSFAPQKAIVFQDTVMENIRAFRDDISDDVVVKACERAHFDEVLRKLPSGLGTVMAQGGMNLSGGQRKRLSLARTLARDAEVYVLDDPYAALDAQTERQVSKKTLDMLRDKTVVMVAQKIASIQSFDRIIVLKDGKIESIGTHEELLRKSDEYRDIYETQCYLEGEANAS